MTTPTSRAEQAFRSHQALPDRIRRYLNKRGIPDELIDSYRLGWNGRRITIPITNAAGEITFCKLAKDPADTSAGPKMLLPRGSSVELYGWDDFAQHPQHLIVCEGEFDRLVLKAHGFPAVTSTGGALTFREEWIPAFAKIPHLYICFDRDEAGRMGAEKVGCLLPQANIVTLPAEVGDKGDITDFFVRLGKGQEDFLTLLQEAEPLPHPPVPLIPEGKPSTRPLSAAVRERIQQVKQDQPLAEIVQRYVRLRPLGSSLKGLCPFHTEKTPSFTVYPKSNRFYCYGCRVHGDVIAFVQKVESISFAEALDALASVIHYHGRSTTPQKRRAA